MGISSVLNGRNAANPYDDGLPRPGMGLFRNLGRKVGEFTGEAKAAASADYRCEACDARFETAHDYCPDCGAEAVVPLEETD